MMKFIHRLMGQQWDAVIGSREEPEVRNSGIPEPLLDDDITAPMGYVDTLGPVALDEEFYASFVDLTHKSNVLDKGKYRRRHKRKHEHLTRIVWHQTGFRWVPYRELAAKRRYSGHHKINAHVCIDRDGSILLLHPFEYYLATANAFNPDCLSIEIMGNFEGVLGQGNFYKPEKFGEYRPLRIQLQRARQLTLWLRDPEQGPPDEELAPMLLAWRLACRASGCPVRWVNPHDMGTDDRPLDCGSEVWWHVGEWTVSCLSGMSIGPPAGKGKDIQEAWRAPPALLP